MFSIPLMRPYLPKDVNKMVLDVLASGHITEGKITADLEEIVKTYLDVHHCIATTSCTTGLELALRCLNIGEGDEVIVPAFTYPATADAVCIVGATPVFVDVNMDTMLVDYDHLERAITPTTKAIMPVSLFGNPLDYDRLNEIKKQHDLFIVEDAACALSSEFKGTYTGKHADISVFSLHPRKFITTGEGGLITTDNTIWADWIRSYKRFGIEIAGNNMEFISIGTNCKLSDILSAIGVVQMHMIQHLIIKRQKQASYYLELLKDVRCITLPQTTLHGKHSYQSFCILVKNRDDILNLVRSKGIEVQFGSFFLPEQPAFEKFISKQYTKDMRGSLKAKTESLALPLYHDMTNADQEKVVEALTSAIQAVA